jgi:MFS family permease
VGAGRGDSAGEVPEPKGYPEAIQGLGSVAAPLLAGFSFTLVVYTLTATAAFRWPNAVLVLILGAALALITSVQCAMVARLFVVGPRTGPGHGAAHRLWARRTERLYNAGILLLLAGITVALVPPGPPGEMGARLAAIAVGLLGLAGAGLWMGAAHPPARWIASRFLAEPAAEGSSPRTRVAAGETAKEDA